MRTPQLADNLRRAVLQAAIEGKLNDRTSEDAGDLLAAIQTEKAAQQKTGKQKKNKPLAAISEEEIPFAIPENWVWVRLGDAFFMQAGKYIKANDIAEKGEYPCFGGNGIRGYTKFFNREGHFPLIGRQGALCGNINIANGRFYATEHAVVVQTFADCDPLWAGYFLTALNLNQYATSTAQPGLSVEKISTTLIPLPPLSEQQQIVAKLNQLLSEIDNLKTQEQALLAAQNAFPKKLRAAILQAAIQGELNERTNENARDLLAAIQAEKAALQKTGKLKKDKPLAAISEEEIPFAIPENWVWVRLGDVASLSSGYAFKSTDYTSTGVRVIRISDFNNGNFDNKNIVRHPFREDLSSYLINSKDILLCMTGGTVGKNILVNEPPEQLYLNQRVARISAKTLDIKYLFYFINSSIIQDHISRIKNSTNDNISMKDISEFLIPLPPLTEQQQIVAKLEALLAEIDTLENAT
ncbi:restriction endonuclease subunit S [uncultured Cardiobacterium sp.]|uniref:restriction endonuclease subunit S n=1 Tax=uncultured Cardiobacterium sp. TaxID=417619 RepID=UPI00261DFB65|nr:restriction endonuclease subunit S [uncultured Cardiobacterium sp.]